MRDIAWTRSEEGTPLYLQLARSLREHISSGGIDPGSALPSERDLSEMAGLSRVTVRKGIEQLIDEGVLVRKQGSGTFVARRIETAGSRLSSFSDDTRSRGENPGVVWIYKSYAQPTEEEAAALEVPATARVARLGRVRLAGGEPLAIEHAVIPAEFMPDLDSLGDSLYQALEAHGFRPTSGTQRVRASLATQTEAGILCVQQNSEVLRIERTTRVPNGQIVEFTRSVYRGDRYEFVTDLKEI
ncbi:MULTISPECIES: GntR family transcriptional regulator [Novosphingobium]|uniref:GntR family transcriptional regulator n=1 Tax=unclassified Novosphingobium TaxID=2644732 RepID=UPI0006C86E61|nr:MULTISPECIES: GntR family transcriptional regulator [unclassified Novosphingobium]KPH58182.1 GntR family transcriptional regulator [Novosphingobium sp. ST904]TCM41309.1 GntR family transcriptional regulator [Novosphingobium sp. ST904]WRT95532.1 GntR family transcriptional regulator [Novosphingobium sp. RL4]